MTKLKYYEASVDNDNFVVVEATSPGQAKNKFINGNVVPFFAGYDNFDCEFTEVRVRRLKKLDRFEPDDYFHILKTLIKEYGWTFSDGFCELDDSSYSDESLRHYLEYGDVEYTED